MAYTNSSMVAYTKLSPNHSGQRTHSIDRITPHCVVGQCTAEGLGDWFYKSSTQASSNYGIDRDGRVGMYVEEKNRSWCSSSSANDQRAITIECASDTTEPYAFRDIVYQTLIKLCVDICKRNGKTKLLWLGDKDKTLNYEPKSGEMILTVHRWFANKSCPGNWMYARMGDLAEKVTAALGSGTDGKDGPTTTQGTQATAFSPLSDADVVKSVGTLFTADQKKTGILASVSMAQFILESGYGKSELAQNANNVFGMKCSLSGNTWNGSAWDGKSKYTKQTKEQNADGSYETITADFRKYPCVEDSIADHSTYLLGAKNGSKLRYDGLKGCTDYKKAVQIIKDGGYATSLTYVQNLCSMLDSLFAELQKSGNMEHSFRLKDKALCDGITRQELADKAGIERSTLYTALRGNTVSRATAEKIAAALDMKLDKAFDDVTERNGLSGSSTNKLKLNLSAIFTAAVKKEIMRRNPCKLVTPPKVDTAPAAYLDETQCHKLLDLLSQQDDFQFEVIINLFIASGIRSGELSALYWEDINLDTGMMFIRHTLVRVDGVYIRQEPKTADSTRRIILPEYIIGLLKKHKAKQAERRFKMGGRYKNPDLVFTNKSGGFIMVPLSRPLSQILS